MAHQLIPRQARRYLTPLDDGVDRRAAELLLWARLAAQAQLGHPATARQQSRRFRFDVVIDL